MAHPYADKIPGSKTAQKRYGSTGSASMKSPGDDSGKRPQFEADKQAPGYDNDVPNNWLRGNGMKPGFDKGRK